MSQAGQTGRYAASSVVRAVLGFAVLVACLFAGTALVRWTGLPVPPSVMGMAILIVALACFARLEASVGLAATPLLKHMMLCFIPAVAGVMEQFAVLKTGWLPFVAASVLGGALTLVVTALTFQVLMKRKEVA